VSSKLGNADAAAPLDPSLSFTTLVLDAEADEEEEEEDFSFMPWLGRRDFIDVEGLLFGVS
jgi:hypothetical protein